MSPLNVWIPEDLRDYVARRADDEKHPMNAIIADLIRDDIVKRNEQLTEQTSLIMLQEMVGAVVRTEIRKAHAQLRQELQQSRQREAESFSERLRSYLDRIVSLQVAAVRNGGIARRLAYAALSKYARDQCLQNTGKSSAWWDDWLACSLDWERFVPLLPIEYATDAQRVDRPITGLFSKY